MEKCEFLRGVAAGLRMAVGAVVDDEGVLDVYRLAEAADVIDRDAERLESKAKKKRDRFYEYAAAIVEEVMQI